MTYAHIFKTRSGFTLVLSTGPEPTGTELSFPDKKSAKAHAKSVGAKPWNY